MSHIRCWTCNGNGLETLPPTWQPTRCTACGGTGCDAEQTRKCVSSSERSFPSPLPPLLGERDDQPLSLAYREDERRYSEDPHRLGGI